MKLLLAVLFSALVVVAQTTHSATLTWTDTVNPAGTTYNIYRFSGTCTSPTWTTPLVTGITAKTYVDNTVVAGNYCYAATAVYQSAESAKSNYALAPIPAFAPTGLNVSVTPNTAVLTWTDALNPAGATYSVYRALGLCSGSPTFSKIANGLTVKTYVDSTVSIGAYCYTVTATVSGMESSQSGTSNASIPPSAPGGLTVTFQ